MTQTVTGSGLGIYGSSIGLGNYGPKSTAALGQGGDSVYVNAANGNVIIRQSDGFLSDVGFGLDLFQTYNSRGEQGSSWLFNVQSRLELVGELNQKDSFVIRVAEDGHRTRFVWDNTQHGYRSEEGGAVNLSFNQTGWVYREGSFKTTFHYDLNGSLKSINDRDGHDFSFIYQNGQLSSIRSSNGKQTITWSFSNGLLKDLTSTSNGEVIHHLHYDYDEQQRLHRVSRDLGQGKTYWITYDYLGDSNQINEIRQSDGTQLHMDYDAEGRVIQLIDGEGRVTRYHYGQGQTTVSNGMGESWTYYYDARCRLIGINGPEQYQIRFRYEGNQLSTIIQGTQIRHFRYNEAGDCIYQEEPNGQIIKRLYDAEHHVLAETQYQSFDGNHHPVKPKTTRYVYDTKGHLQFVIKADGTVTEYRYTTDGQLMSSRCYLHAAYDIQALNEQDTLSEEELTHWVAQQKPQEISLIDYLYDWRGQLTEEIHYSKVNDQGVGSANDATRVRTLYDASGRLVEKSVQTTKGWSTTHYFYDDLGRLTQISDAQNNSQKFEYDDVHQRMIQTDANGLQTQRIYDHSGLLIATIRLDATHDYGTITYQYDNSGRLIAETGVDGLTAYCFYDAQGRVHAKISAQGLMSEYRYNEYGLLIQTHQYAQRINTKDWLKTRPTLESITPRTSNTDRISHIIYTADNQVAYVVDAQGAVIGYTYDAQGHVLSKTAYAHRLKNVSPDVLLRYEDIDLKTDKKDRSIIYYYDVEGRLQAEINAEGYATEYHYNRLGLLLETSRYKTPISNLSGDWLNDKPLAHRSDIHTYSLYDAQGLKTADIDGEGYLTEYRYNLTGHLQERISYEFALILPLEINEYTTLDNIRPELGANDHHTSYRYNDLSQLIEEKAQNGLITTYAYDEAGHLILKSRMDEQTYTLRQQRMRYDALGRVIQQLDEFGCAKLNEPNLNAIEIEALWQKHSIYYTYDNTGLLLSKTDALQQTTRYFYDEYGQLRYTINADGAVLETQYNVFHQVESIRHYSVFLKGSLLDLTTKEIQARLELLKNDHFDEVITYEYNSIGQIIAKREGSKGLITSQYNAFGELEFRTQVIDPFHQNITSYSYDRRGFLINQVDDVEGLARRTAMEYNAFGWMTKRIDGRNQAVGYSFNKRGEQVLITSPKSRYKSLSYDAFGRTLSETDYTAKVVKTYTYNDQNNTLVVTNPLANTKVITQFNALGDKVSLIDAKNNKTEFHYDEHGLLIRVDSPEDTFKEYHYDEIGQLLWQNDAGGHKIVYTYDAQGHRLTKRIDPEGLNLCTTYTYDAIGRQLQITESSGCIKQFTYDSQGLLIESCIDPKGLNLVTQYTYDARGLLLRQTEFNSNGLNRITAYEWDQLGRRSATIIGPDGLSLTTRYQYDANDNLVCLTDANQNSTHYVYDVMNQCRYQIDPRHVVTEHVYNIRGNEIQTITYAKSIGPLENYSEASLKAALIEDSAHDQYRFRIFDANGRMLWIYDALGYATQYHYDGNDNVIEICRYAKAVSLDALKRGEIPNLSKDDARIQYFIYDNLNQLRFQCDKSGYIIEFQYDSSGQLQTRTQYAQRINLSDSTAEYTVDSILERLKPTVTLDKTTRTIYDQAGRLNVEISPLGIAKSYQYNGLNQVVSCTRYALLASTSLLDLNELQKSAQDRINYFIYDAAGREVYRVSSEGQVVERGYDEVGNILFQRTYQQRVPPKEYNAEDLQKMLLDENNNARTSTYKYDAAGRLHTETNAAQHDTCYEYDSNGNVKRKTQVNKAVWAYRYDEANQLIEITSPITQITTASGTQERSIITLYQYDNFGNVLSKIHDATELKQTRLYEYDSMNHLIRTIYPDVKVNSASANASNQRQEVSQILTEECFYNAFGELITSIDKAGHLKHFAYDNQGQLTYSVDTKGGLTRYDYDTFGRLKCKIFYNNPLILSKDSDYSVTSIAKAHQDHELDRHEYFNYDLDDQVIEWSRDKVRIYNDKANQHEQYRILQPTTQKIYNAFGEIIQTRTRINETDWASTTFYYDKDGHQTASIDAEGYLTAHTLDAFGAIRSTTEYALRAEICNLDHYEAPPKNSKDRTMTFTYDALGQITSKTLKQVSIQRLQNGKVENITRDLTTTYCYDVLGNVTQTSDAKGNTSYCYYNSLGQLIATIAPQTQDGRAATTYSYNALGQLHETRQWAAGAVIADADHFALKGATNKDIINRQEYDIEGQLISETNGLNHTVHYSYDAAGNLARSFTALTQIDGSILIQDKRYTYDSEHHLLQTATFKNNGTLKTEDAQYTVFGEITAKGIDGQYTIHVDYDHLGRVWRSNTQGYYQIYVYDLADHVTQIVTSTNSFHPDHKEYGVDLSASYFSEYITHFNDDSWLYTLQRQNNSYDALGHLVSQSREFTTYTEIHDGKLHLERATQSQTVDRWGNMLSYTNALGYETHYQYNAFNEVIQQELPSVSVMDEQGVSRQLKPVNYYAYDELGQMIAITDANGHTFYKEYDAAGQIILETDAKGNSRIKHYNLLNQLDSTTNELGGMTTYTYDAANRLISVVTPKTKQNYVYDEAGQLIQQQNGAGDSLRFKYDALGNQISRQDTRGFTTTYEYDDAGHKIKEIDAKGNSQTWVFDENGRLQRHKDLGNHETYYEYNVNGLLLHEQSTQGKNINYHYQGDGALFHYNDEARHEEARYSYDAEGQMLIKESSRAGNDRNWIREIDHYQYDSFGRLIAIRRRNPEDTDKRFPDKDHALLSVDYDYDAMGNIRHTNVTANYTGYHPDHSEDYYLYDENNRMVLNKGQLINGHIEMTQAQGSTLSYDAAGNIVDARKYEFNTEQKYHYVYNKDNQLELTQKNNINLQSKEYDASGRVIWESAFDNHNNLTQKNHMSYEQGELTSQITYNGSLQEQARATYQYDQVGNMTDWSIRNRGDKNHLGYTLSHHYTYALWDNYQQEHDKVSLVPDGRAATYGSSTRIYDVNGLLQKSIDAKVDGDGKTNTTYYWNSSIDGIKARVDREGQTSYLNVAGKTIGDFSIDNQNKQKLTIYGGFTPTGAQQTPAGTSRNSAKEFQNRLQERYASFTQSQSHQSFEAPGAPQDNLGAYTLQAGDTLESIALQVYGDSGLWYLIADANGITERNAYAGNDGPLHIGQRLNIPPAATGQHHTNVTHKVFNANQKIGNTQATAPLPPPPPIPKTHHNLLAKIVVSVVAVVATVLTAGVLGVGGFAGLDTLFHTGLSVLGGGIMSSTSSTLAAGFSAGFIGSMASQGVANALGLQKDLDFKSALITGMATAATAGFGRALNGLNALGDLKKSLNDLPLSKNFNIASAAELMEQNATSQGLNVALRRHQHFDWEALGIAGITGGILGSDLSKRINHTLNQIDNNSGFLSSEYKSLLTEGTQTALTGTHFNAAQVLTENLGDAVASAITNLPTSKTPLEQIEGLSLSDDLQKMKEEARAFNYYMAQQLEGDGGYGDLAFTEDRRHSSPESIPSRFNDEVGNHTELNHKIRVSSLSIKFETGKEASDYHLAAGMVSTGKQDIGGISYGAFQLASSTGNVWDFLKNEGSEWANEFKGLDPRKSGPFGDKWKKIAETQGEAFFIAQYDYIYNTHFKEVKNYLRKQTGLDIDNQPEAVQAAFWSASVQHGRARFFLKDAINSLSIDRTNSNYAAKLINAVYDKRINYVSGLDILNKQNLINKRFPYERLRALSMLKN